MYAARRRLTSSKIEARSAIIDNNNVDIKAWPGTRASPYNRVAASEEAQKSKRIARRRSCRGNSCGLQRARLASASSVSCRNERNAVILARNSDRPAVDNSRINAQQAPKYGGISKNRGYRHLKLATNRHRSKSYEIVAVVIVRMACSKFSAFDIVEEIDDAPVSSATKMPDFRGCCCVWRERSLEDICDLKRSM